MVGAGTGGAFRWTQEQGLTMLGDLQGGGVPPRSGAYAVSADGEVIVGYAKGGGIQAFRWTEAGGMLGLGFLPNPTGESQAFALSADGSVIVGFSETAEYPHGEAFRWENGKMVGLGVLPGFDESRAYAVTGDGKVIVGDSGDAFRWTGATGMVSLGEGRAQGISADGSIIVGVCGADPVLWDGTGQKYVLRDLFVNQYNLNLTAWELFTVAGVSADGLTFAGHAVGPNGPEAWIAHIPEPATLALFALGLALTAGGRGRWAGVRH